VIKKKETLRNMIRVDFVILHSQNKFAMARHILPRSGQLAVFIIDHSNPTQKNAYLLPVILIPHTSGRVHVFYQSDCLMMFNSELYSFCTITSEARRTNINWNSIPSAQS
jgi:hypothetical protein